MQTVTRRGSWGWAIWLFCTSRHFSASLYSETAKLKKIEEEKKNEGFLYLFFPRGLNLNTRKPQGYFQDGLIHMRYG